MILSFNHFSRSKALEVRSLICTFSPSIYYFQWLSGKSIEVYFFHCFLSSYKHGERSFLRRGADYRCSCCWAANTGGQWRADAVMRERFVEVTNMKCTHSEFKFTNKSPSTTTFNLAIQQQLFFCSCRILCRWKGERLNQPIKMMLACQLCHFRTWRFPFTTFGHCLGSDFNLTSISQFIKQSVSRWVIKSHSMASQRALYKPSKPASESKVQQWPEKLPSREKRNLEQM